MSAVAKRLHTVAIYAAGHGTAGLEMGDSGERRVIDLVAGREGPVVLDVGAFEGEYGLMARRVLGAQAEIHCFEPNPTAFTRLESHPDLTVHNVALAGSAGSRTLYADPEAPTMASLEADTLHPIGLSPTAEMTVTTTTVDRFCSEHGIDHVDLLKVDVEGTELEVLRGAPEVLRQHPVVQFEFGYGNLARRTFLRDFYELLGSGYLFHRVAPKGLVPLGPYRLELEVFVSATNYVAIPG